MQHTVEGPVLAEDAPDRLPIAYVAAQQRALARQESLSGAQIVHHDGAVSGLAHGDQRVGADVAGPAGH